MNAGAQTQKGISCKRRYKLITFLLWGNLSKYILNKVLLLCDLKALWWLMHPLLGLHMKRATPFTTTSECRLGPLLCFQTKSCLFGLGLKCSWIKCDTSSLHSGPPWHEMIKVYLNCVGKLVLQGKKCLYLPPFPSVWGQSFLKPFVSYRR